MTPAEAGLAGQSVADRSASGAAEKARLRRVLGRTDAVLFLLSAMVVTDTIGAVAAGGGQALTWLLVLAATFFVPSALISAELGAALPEEGGIYVWVRRAFGRYPGALASALYWACTPVWVGGSVAVLAMAVWQRFIGPLPTAGLLLLGAAFVGAATAAAVIPLRISARTGVPVRIGLVSGAVALAVMAAGVAVTGHDNQKYFSAALTAVIALVVLSYLLVFPAFARLRRREPGLERPFRLPGNRGGASLATAAATGWSLLAAGCLLWPGLGTGNPDAHLPAGFAGQRGQFELLALTPVVLIVAAATAYCLATRNRAGASPRKEQ